MASAKKIAATGPTAADGPTLVISEGLARRLGEPKGPDTMPVARVIDLSGKKGSPAPFAPASIWLPVPGYPLLEATRNGRQLRSWASAGRPRIDGTPARATVPRPATHPSKRGFFLKGDGVASSSKFVTYSQLAEMVGGDPDTEGG